MKMTYDYIAKLHKKMYRDGFDAGELEIVAKKHLKYIPRKKLYRYRQCNEMELNTLKKNSIWLADPDKFQDMFDSIVPMVSNEQIEWEYFFELFLEISYKAYAKVQEEYGEEAISYEEWVETLNAHLETANINELQETYEEFLDGYEDERLWNLKPIIKEAVEIRQFLSAIRKYPRENYSIASFTSTYDNMVMWENYALDYKGFCVEYDLEKIIIDHSKSKLEDILYFLPIKYYKKRPLFDSAYFIKNFIKYKMSQGSHGIEWEIFFEELYKTMLSKKKDYSYEKEWRFMIHNHTCGEYHFPYVSRIILGKDILEHDEKCLREIADALNVNVYRQQFNLELDKMDYVKIQ